MRQVNHDEIFTTDRLCSARDDMGTVHEHQWSKIAAPALEYSLFIYQSIPPLPPAITLGAMLKLKSGLAIRCKTSLCCAISFANRISTVPVRARLTLVVSWIDTITNVTIS